MLNFLNKFRKAALQNAAFFILIIALTRPLAAKPIIETLETVHTKATNFLLQKQKKQALQSISDYIKIENNKASLAEANDFLETVSKTFMVKESQEAYETSVIMTFENNKEAIKQIELCLQLDPQNADCLVQRIRLAARNKNVGAVESNLLILKQTIPNTKTDQWVSLSLKKLDLDFKNKTILKKLSEKPTEDTFVLATLELDRSFAAKNFSRAKDVIQYLDKNFADWPDIIFYKQKIETESAEEKLEPDAEVISLYTAKCKNLNKSTTRKYRYDFDLCSRGQP